MHSSESRSWECTRRHPSRSSFLVEDTTSRLFCLVCATQVLGEHVVTLVHMTVAISRLSELKPEALRVAAQEDAAILDDLIGSLLRSLERASTAENADLSSQIARVILYITLSCDGHELVDDVLSGSNVDLPGSCVNFRFLESLVQRLFGVVCGSDDVHESSSLPFPSLSSFISLAYSAVHTLLGDWNWADGISPGPRADIFCSIVEGTPNITRFCAVLLDYIEAYSGGTMHALPETACLLCAMLSTNRQDVLDIVWSRYRVMFQILQDVQMDWYRECILSLAVAFLYRFTSHEGASGGAQLEATAPSSAPNLPDEASFILTHKPCSPVADALKACSQSRSPLVQWLSFRIVAMICTNNQCENISSDLVPSGYADFLLESLRADHRCEAKDQDPAFKNIVSVSCMKSLAVIAKKYSRELRSKWVYGIPILVRAAEKGLDSTVISNAFTTLIIALQPTFSPPIPLDSNVICTLMQLVLHGGAKFSLLSSRGSPPETESHGLLADGIEVLGLLLQSCRFRVQEIPLLLSCVECAGLVVPHCPGASLLARSTADLMLEFPVADLTADIIENVQKVLLATWGAACHGEVSKGSSSATGVLLVLDGLYTVASALDPRYFAKSQLEEQAQKRLHLWDMLSPKSVFEYLENAQNGVLSQTVISENSDAHQSPGGSVTETKNPGVVTRFELSDTDPQDIRFYLSRLICSGTLHRPFSDITPRVFEKHVPSSFESLRAQVKCPTDPQQLLVTMLLLEQTMLHTGNCILSGEEVSSELIQLTESDRHIPMVSACSLHICRLLFKLDHLGNAVDGFVLGVDFCWLLLTSAEFDLSNLEDRLCLLHIIEKTTDTQLRRKAWLVYAKGRYERNHHERTYLDQAAVIVLTQSTGAANCLVFALGEETSYVREMVIELCVAFPCDVVTALDQAGLCAALMGMLERGASIDRTTTTQAENEAWGKITSELVEIVALRIQQTGYDGQEVILMRLLDLFAKSESSAGPHCMRHFDSPVGPANSTCGLPSSGHIRTIDLDLSILRCLIVVLNQSPAEIREIQNSFLLEYFCQSGSLEKVAAILLHGAETIHAISTNFLSEASGFLVAAAATLLDYLMRYEVQNLAFRNSEHFQRLVLILSQNEASMECLVSASHADRYSYTAESIQTASIRLYVTWLHISKLDGSDVQGPAVSQHLHISLIDLASSASPLSADAATQLLQTLFHKYFNGSTCPPGSGPFAGIGQFSSERKLLRYLQVKFAKSPGDSSHSEFNYLASAFRNAKLEGDDSKDFLHALFVLLSIYPRQKYLLKQETLDICFGVLNDVSSFAGSSLSSICTDQEWRALKDKIEILEREVISTNQPETGCAYTITWRVSDLLLGRRAVLSAPIVVTDSTWTMSNLIKSAPIVNASQ